MTDTRHELTPFADLERPTSVRFVVVALAVLMSFLLYLHRYVPSFLLPFMSQEFGLSEVEESWFLSVFFWSYALAQVPTGWLNDRFGARLVLTIYMVAWSMFTGLLGVATAFVFLLVLRLGSGLAQSGAYPTGASMVSKWVPFSSRALASGWVVLGGRLGAALAPVLAAYVLLSFVPVSIPSLLNLEDLLGDHADLAACPEEGKDSPKDQVSRLIRDRLELPERVTSTVGLLDAPLGQGALGAAAGCFPGGPKRPPAPQQVSRAELLDVLNDLLRQPDLYDHVDVDQLQLPGEAYTLAALSAHEATGEQITRRNRLLLEAAFPRHIRKIYGQGWRPVTIVFGVAGLVIALLFLWGVRNQPREHPGCNVAEQQLIELGSVERPDDTPAGPPPDLESPKLPAVQVSVTSPRGQARALPMRCILGSRSLWLSSISQFGTNFGWVFLALLLPKYLEEVHHVPPILRGWMSGLPLGVGMIGMLYGGWLTDRLTRALGVRWGRRLPMALTRFVAMAAYLVCLGLESPWLLTVAFCFVTLATDLGTSSVWAFCQDVGGKHVGSVLGWGNMWGNIGAAVSPLVLLTLLRGSGPGVWEARFLACAAAFALSGITALGVDATIPIVPPEEADRV